MARHRVESLVTLASHESGLTTLVGSGFHNCLHNSTHRPLEREQSVYDAWELFDGRSNGPGLMCDWPELLKAQTV